MVIFQPVISIHYSRTLRKKKGCIDFVKSSVSMIIYSRDLGVDCKVPNLQISVQQSHYLYFPNRLFIMVQCNGNFRSLRIGWPEGWSYPATDCPWVSLSLSFSRRYNAGWWSRKWSGESESQCNIPAPHLLMRYWPWPRHINCVGLGSPVIKVRIRNRNSFWYHPQNGFMNE